MDARKIVIEVMKEVQGLGKHDKNTSQGFSFRGIDSVMNAVGPALRKHGGFISPKLIELRNSTGVNSNGKTLNIVHVVIDYQVFGSEGEPIVGRVAAEAFDSGDKATAKAMSVAFRTFILQLLCLPTDEPDPDSFSYELGKGDWEKLYQLAGEQFFAKDIAGLRDTFVKAQSSGMPKDRLEKIQEWGKQLGNS